MENYLRFSTRNPNEKLGCENALYETNRVPPKRWGKTVEEEHGSKFDSNNFFYQNNTDVQGWMEHYSMFMFQNSSENKYDVTDVR